MAQSKVTDVQVPAWPTAMLTAANSNVLSSCGG